MTQRNFFLKLQSAFRLFQTTAVSEYCSTKLLPRILSKTYINILALKMASPVNRYCANCIGTISFPIIWRRLDRQRQTYLYSAYKFKRFTKRWTCAVREIRSRTDRQTDRHAHHNTPLHYSTGAGAMISAQKSPASETAVYHSIRSSDRRQDNNSIYSEASRGMQLTLRL